MFSYAPHDMYQTHDCTIQRESVILFTRWLSGPCHVIFIRRYRLLRRQYLCVVIVHTLKEVLAIGSR